MEVKAVSKVLLTHLVRLLWLQIPSRNLEILGISIQHVPEPLHLTRARLRHSLQAGVGAAGLHDAAQVRLQQANVRLCPLLQVGGLLETAAVQVA